ncbi:hypothetical protein BD769DRAFT_1386968 [Suillus cothurnatus]|nr:hypothetical protein BD769DRAFT_1386968 [Suillus cothurnatus]
MGTGRIERHRGSESGTRRANIVQGRWENVIKESTTNKVFRVKVEGLNQAVLCAGPHAQSGSAHSTNIKSNFISAWQHTNLSTKPQLSRQDGNLLLDNESESYEQVVDGMELQSMVNVSEELRLRAMVQWSQNCIAILLTVFKLLKTSDAQCAFIFSGDCTVYNESPSILATSALYDDYAEFNCIANLIEEDLAMSVVYSKSLELAEDLVHCTFSHERRG